MTLLGEPPALTTTSRYFFDQSLCFELRKNGHKSWPFKFVRWVQPQQFPPHSGFRIFGREEAIKQNLAAFCDFFKNQPGEAWPCGAWHDSFEFPRNGHAISA
ncbi:MAG: hypothetical protein A3B37_00960 [Candidatus Sungbacteria bacterium RIFCSPLOWO2_01_FULL_59_16]|uniref:Uncharacterized protein n=1 Tax=Candidatus Sungbacteria bacterium RIFCSPLOWO2_01_FULL_59_16 TaxID=1802280 RepID=A0A1G2LBW5_9BACT|nr:MAG: hypothetical protein A3B37_00960 [Candidatus Sungbacteria bacterium RIFCSPLOWO2_01_FULL_59_16]